MKNDHPYREFETLKVWKVLSQGVKDLEANGDIQQTTAREYIVGYLSKLLIESNLVIGAPQASDAQVNQTVQHP